MTRISEDEFARICRGISEDRATIYRHNPIGTEEETLLWMLLSVLTIYLSLSEIETPCFNGMPTAETYREAITFILRERKTGEFDVEKYLDEMTKGNN
jgi:ssDNA-specific exonuclease RecJ